MKKDHNHDMGWIITMIYIHGVYLDPPNPSGQEKSDAQFNRNPSTNFTFSIQSDFDSISHPGGRGGGRT